MSALLSFIPRSATDKIAFVFTWFTIHLICFFELLVVLPSAHKDQPFEYAKHVVLGLYLYFNVITSLVLTIKRDSTTKHMMLPAILKPGWRFCASCEANSPPRAFHCWSCDICVLRRDHHCIFTGNCIGLHNHRHFLTFGFYLLLGALYCNYLNMEMVWAMLAGFSVKSVITMIAPFLAWVLGLTEGYSFGVAIIASTCILGTLLLVALIAYHGNNLKNGQVTYEATHRVKEFNLGWQGNCRQVFGVNWKYAWLCSLIPSPLPTDGTLFPTKLTLDENVKTM